MDALERTLEQKVTAEAGASRRVGLAGPSDKPRPGFPVPSAAPGTGLGLVSTCFSPSGRANVMPAPSLSSFLPVLELLSARCLLLVFIPRQQSPVTHLLSIYSVRAEYFTPRIQCAYW